eukprot:m.14874 g.14874  ORF g.14874 m.14874 type:complete len:164 (-) comp10364_c0_seq1:53-544(-)
MESSDSQSSLRRASLFEFSRPDIAATSQVDHSTARDGSDMPRRPITPLENTYQLEPEVKFSSKAVLDIINEVLPAQLEEEEYELKSSRQMAKTLSTIITNRVKSLNFARYKIVTLVTIGEVADQGVRVASRGLYDQEKDTFVSGSYKNSSLFSVATVYGVYFE